MMIECYLSTLNGSSTDTTTLVSEKESLSIDWNIKSCPLITVKSLFVTIHKSIQFSAIPQMAKVVFAGKRHNVMLFLRDSLDSSHKVKMRLHFLVFTLIDCTLSSWRKSRKERVPSNYPATTKKSSNSSRAEMNFLAIDFTRLATILMQSYCDKNFLPPPTTTFYWIIAAIHVWRIELGTNIAQSLVSYR